MEPLNIFNQHGLSGLVIGALFVSLWYFIKEIRHLNDSNNQRIDKITATHTEERESWLKAYQDNTDALRRIFDHQK